jgi:Tol biopolymer transport system component
LQAIGEARIALANQPAEDADEVPVTPVLLRRSKWIASWAALATLATGVALWMPWRTIRTEEKPLVRLNVDLGPDVSLGTLTGRDIAISPDGTRIAFVSNTRLFTRRLDESKAVELPGTSSASEPVFSPDGQWILFVGGGVIKKVSVAGGSPLPLGFGSSARGVTWDQDGAVVAALGSVGGLMRIPADGGAPTPLTKLAPGEATHRWPQVLPGGRGILFTSHVRTSGFDQANIEVFVPRDHRRKVLLRGGAYGRYLASGQLVYVNRGSLFAAPFDLDKLELRGAPSPVLEGIGYSAIFGTASFDVSGAGTFIYRSGGISLQKATLQWLDNAGRLEPLLAKPGLYERPRLSPDGRQVALLMADDAGRSDNWVYDWKLDTMTRLTTGEGLSYTAWSPEGRFVIVQTSSGMAWTRSDGGGKIQSLTHSLSQQFPWDFSPDGKRLAYFEASRDTVFDLWTVPIEGTSAGLKAGKPEPFLATAADERWPVFSPDGKWVAYGSTDSGTFQVYVRAFPDRGGKWQVSTDSGVLPWWSKTGHELFYRTEDNERTMVVAYRVEGDSFVPEKPRLWLDKPILNLSLVGNYDLDPDGKRILALMPAEGPEHEASKNHVTFLFNFFDYLRRRVGTGK